MYNIYIQYMHIYKATNLINNKIQEKGNNSKYLGSGKRKKK